MAAYLSYPQFYNAQPMTQQQQYMPTSAAAARSPTQMQPQPATPNQTQRNTQIQYQPYQQQTNFTQHQHQHQHQQQYQQQPQSHTPQNASPGPVLPHLEMSIPVRLLVDSDPSAPFEFRSLLLKSCFDSLSVRSSRVLELSLEDPHDPAFLFRGEFDSSRVKQLIDTKELRGSGLTFENVTHELERHLRKVIEKHGKQIQDDECQMVCEFELHANRQGEHRFSIQSRVNGEPLPWWSLPFRPANDAEIKQFMLDAWNNERNKCDKLEAQVISLQEHVSELDAASEATRQRLHQMSIEQGSALDKERMKSERDLLDERSRHAQDRASLVKEHESATMKLTHEWTSKWNHLNALHDALQQELTNSDTEKNMANKKLAALQMQHDHIDAEAQTLRADKEQLRKECTQLRDANTKQSDELATLRIKVAQLESQCTANSELLLMAKDGGSQEQAKGRLLEQSVATLQRDLAHITEKHNLTLAEFERGQEVMVKLQNRLRECKASLDRKRDTISKLEKTIESNERDLRDGAHRASDLQRDIVSLEGDKSRLEAELTRAQQQTKDCLDQLEISKRQFEALSKEKTDRTIGSFAGMTTGTYHAPTNFVSAMHTTSTYQPSNSFLPTPTPAMPYLIQPSSHSATSLHSTAHLAGITTPMQPALPQRASGNLDFDSPSPGAALHSHKSNPAPPLNVSQYAGISASARAYLADRAAQQSHPNTFLPLPRTNNTTAGAGKENSPAMHTETLFHAAIDAKPTHGNVNNTTANHRQPLAQLNGQRNNQSTQQHLYTKQQPEPLARYAPNTVDITAQ